MKILILLACLPISFGCQPSSPPRPPSSPPPSDCSYCPRCVQVEREQVFGGTQADKREVSFYFVVIWQAKRATPLYTGRNYPLLLFHKALRYNTRNHPHY